ncbi:MAG TPA: single-stranded DNA-binding protein [Dermatophilaceae bacterium]|nr:single-stranded DNA-binding protein [Dermatophilaceae bacterium]
MTASPASSAGAAAVDDASAQRPGVNEVTLRGRVSGSPTAKQLPSGDVVLLMRLVVPRPPAAAQRNGGRNQVDTIDVAVWTPAQRRKALRLTDGDVVHVRGALRRRFWRSPGGLASRYEVEADLIERAATPRHHPRG